MQSSNYENIFYCFFLFFQVFFIPLSNTIISCFKDDSIHAWESDSLEYKYEIPPPFGPTPRYRAFAAPQDGHVLVGGGRSNFLHVWAMESRQLLRIIQLPQYVRHVKQLIFLPNSYDGGSSEVRTRHLCLLSPTPDSRPGWHYKCLFSPTPDSRCPCPGWHHEIHQHSHMQAAVSNRLTRFGRSIFSDLFVRSLCLCVSHW